MFKKLIDILKAHPRKIVFTEGTDPRILEASARLLSGTFLTPVLIGKEADIQAAAEDCGFNSASHFARAFRQETDISPTAFRAISF